MQVFFKSLWLIVNISNLLWPDDVIQNSKWDKLVALQVAWWFHMALDILVVF